MFFSESGDLIMSSKQVPEITQLPIPEQMERLKTWVGGHRELFDKYRGGNLYGLSQHQFLVPDRQLSPTADLKEFDRLVGDVRVIRNTFAVLHRDGCSAAAEALLGALVATDRYDRPMPLPFEEELGDKLEPMVLLMFEPEKMLQIMHWYRQGVYFELEALWGRPQENVPSTEIKEITQLLPSLESCWRRKNAIMNSEVFAAISEDILGPFGGMQPWFDSRGYGSPVAALYTGGTCQAGIRGKHIYVHDAYNGVAFAYLLRGVRQDEVLSRIPRVLQGRVATWQFEVYEKTWYGIPQHKVMLIPEAEFSSWQGIHKSSVSKGVSAGQVAVYNPAKVFELQPDGRLRDLKATLVLDNR
jgi:hypothetical protein